MTAARLARLDSQFRIDDRVRIIERDQHGLIVIRMDRCHAEIALQGAQVLRWQPAGQTDLLWCAVLPSAQTGKAIRGGVPVCWPWFGPHSADAHLPQHGMVRTIEWHLVETNVVPDGVRVVFEVMACEALLRMEIEVGSQLRLRLMTRNIGAKPLQITEALHTYFRVGDIDRISIHGLEGCRYRDNTDGGREKVWPGVMRIESETIALFDVAPDVAVIEDPVLGRRIRIVRAGGRSTVAWHPGAAVTALKDVVPGAEKNFVCVESGNIGSQIIVLGPMAEHQLAVDYEITTL